MIFGAPHSLCETCLMCVQYVTKKALSFPETIL